MALLSRSILPGGGPTVGCKPGIALTSLLGGLGLAAASALFLFQNKQTGDLIALISGGLGLVGGLCLCVDGGGTLTHRQSPPALHIPPYLALLVRLICEFRAWSIDPILLDYGFRHLGLIAALMALYCSASLRFGKGSRRLTAFCSMAGICLCATGAVGVTMSELVFYLSLTLLCLGTLLQASGDAQTSEGDPA